MFVVSDTTNEPTTDPTTDPSTDPTADPTFYPSSSPTLDGCDLDLATYLDQCYCEDLQSGFHLGSAHSSHYEDNALNDYELLEDKYYEMLQKYQEFSHDKNLVILALVIIICVQMFAFIIYVRSNRHNGPAGYKQVYLDGTTDDEQQPLH